MRPTSKILSGLLIRPLVLTLLFSKLSVAFDSISNLTDESKTRINERVTVQLQANKFVLVYGSIKFQTGICLANLNRDSTCKCLVHVTAMLTISTLEGDQEFDRGSAYLCPLNDSYCNVNSEVGKSGTTSCSYSIRLNLNSKSEYLLSNSQRLAQFTGTSALRVTAVADIAVYAEVRRSIAIAIMPLKGFTVKLPELSIQDMLLPKSPQSRDQHFPQDGSKADPETRSGTPELEREATPDPDINFRSCISSSTSRISSTISNPNSSETNAAETPADEQPSCSIGPSHKSSASKSISWSIIQLQDAKVLSSSSIGPSDSVKSKSDYDPSHDPSGQGPRNEQEGTYRSQMEFLCDAVNTNGENSSNNSSCQVEASAIKNAVYLGWMFQIILTGICATFCAACSYWIHTKFSKKKIRSSAAVSNSSVQSPVEPEGEITKPPRKSNGSLVQHLKVERQLKWSDDEDFRSDEPSRERPISKGGRCTHEPSFGLRHEINHGSNNSGMPFRISEAIRSSESPTGYQKGGWTRDKQGRLRRLLASGSGGIHACEDFVDETTESRGRVEMEEKLSAEELHSGPNISHLLRLEQASNSS